MGNTQELRFQGLCLLNGEGYRFMGCYDCFPSPIRERLKSSIYNLCAACIRDEVERQAKGVPEVPDYLKVIEAMEQQLKCEEVAV